MMIHNNAFNCNPTKQSLTTRRFAFRLKGEMSGLMKLFRYDEMSLTFNLLTFSSNINPKK